MKKGGRQPWTLHLRQRVRRAAYRGHRLLVGRLGDQYALRLGRERDDVGLVRRYVVLIASRRLFVKMLPGRSCQLADKDVRVEAFKLWLASIFVSSIFCSGSV